jgi:cation diffusion facilitator family transporter
MQRPGGGTAAVPGGAGQARARGRRSALLGLLVNAVLVAVKITAGVIGHSYALIADGVESTTDIFSSLIVWRGLVVAGRDPDARYHFGYGKAEGLAAAIVATMLLAAAAGIAIQAVREIITPHHAPAPFTLVVLVLVVAIKEVLFRHVVAVGEAIGSTAVTVDAWHHRSDAITSAAAFVGIAVAVVGGPRWAVADDYAALAASAIIAANGLRFMRAAVGDLMDRAPAADVLAQIRRTALAVDGVLGIEKILARRSGMGYHLVIHVEADPGMSLHDAHILGGRVRRALTGRLPFVIDAVVHMEPSPGLPAVPSPASEEDRRAP